MALKKYEETDIASIASAIREKTGGDKTYKVSQMPEGVNEVYEAGKEAEREDFYREYATKNTYYMHGRWAGMGWTDTTFRPTEDLNFTGNCSYTFYYNGANVDLVEWCKQLGISILVKPTFANYMFAYSIFTRLPELDFSNLTTLSSTFSGCSELVTIDLLKIHPGGSASFSSTFSGCDELQNITVDGLIAKNIDFKDCTKLTKASIESIMTHLSPTATFTVTLSQTAVNNAFTTEEWQAIIDAKPANVTVSLI